MGGFKYFIMEISKSWNEEEWEQSYYNINGLNKT